MVKLISITSDILDLIKSYENAMSAAYQPVATMLVEPTVVMRHNPSYCRLPNKLTIAFDNVSCHYPDAAESAEAVADFSLTIKKGEKIGLVGYSGSGKTTLTKLLLRFMDATHKVSIMINGIDIRELSQKELRSHIAYVPQEPLLFHRSVAENIAYGKPGASKQAIESAGRAAYVNEFVKDLPLGYDTLVGERGVKLSGGQRQRVAIARALLKDAPIWCWMKPRAPRQPQRTAHPARALATHERPHGAGHRPSSQHHPAPRPHRRYE